MTISSHRSHTPRLSIAAATTPAHPNAPTRAAMDLTGATASGGMAVAHCHHKED
jgi:hypothetical protein